MFTRAEIFKIIGWIIQILVGFVPIWFLQKETKKIERRLEKEIIARKDLERKMVEKNIEMWKSAYYQEKEQNQKNWKIFEEKLEKVKERSNELSEEITKQKRENWNLRNQLFDKGIPWEEHDISDENQQLEIITEIKGRWGAYQDKNEKINEQTINEMLGNWENRLKNKSGKEIIKERNRLLKKIKEEVELARNNNEKKNSLLWISW